MQLMTEKISDKELLHLLAEDMFERNKNLRLDAIANQIREQIVDKWLRTVNKQRIWNKPVKCTVKFVLEGSRFNLATTLEPNGETDMEQCGEYIDYTRRVRTAVNGIVFDLRNNYDLDRIEFGPGPIEVVEYHLDSN